MVFKVYVARFTRDVPASNFALSAVLPEMNILLTLPGGAQVDDLETTWLDHISSHTSI